MRKLILNAGIDENSLRTVRQAGWDGVFTGWNEAPEFDEAAERIRSLGLIYQSIHAPYTRVHLLWEDAGEGGKAETERQIACLRSAARAGVDLVVMHAIIGMMRCTPTELGLERYARIFDAAAELGVRVAVENTEGEVYLDALMQAFADRPNIGFCIDTGHELCYNYGHDLIGKYGHRLFGTHLNDNMGMTGDQVTWYDDSHMLPFDGAADWQGIADRLRRAGYNGMLTFELTQFNKPERHTSDAYEAMDYAGFVSAALERARRFGELMGD